MSTKLIEKTAAEAAERPVAAFEVLHEDDKTCITLFTIKPGEQTGWHRHEYDYVAVQQSTGRLHFDYADGSTREIDYTPGVAVAVAAPVEHNAVNVGEVDIIALEIEYKK